MRILINNIWPCFFNKDHVGRKAFLGLFKVGRAALKVFDLRFVSFFVLLGLIFVGNALFLGHRPPALSYFLDDFRHLRAGCPFEDFNTLFFLKYDIGTSGLFWRLILSVRIFYSLHCFVELLVLVLWIWVLWFSNDACLLSSSWTLRRRLTELLYVIHDWLFLVGFLFFRIWFSLFTLIKANLVIRVLVHWVLLDYLAALLLWFLAVWECWVVVVDKQLNILMLLADLVLVKFLRGIVHLVHRTSNHGHFMLTRMPL